MFSKVDHKLRCQYGTLGERINVSTTEDEQWKKLLELEEEEGTPVHINIITEEKTQSTEFTTFVTYLYICS